MDTATIAGLILAIGALAVGALLEGINLMNLISPSALIIILGGTFGATIVSFSIKEVKNFWPITKQAFKSKSLDAAGVISTLVGFAEKARREGLLVLEDDAAQTEDSFLKKGIQLVVDGTDMELVRSILETELAFLEDRHKIGEGIYMQLGGFSPTLGIIGTIMGLIMALGEAGGGGAGSEALVEKIAVAFLATFYGIAFANLVFLPIANKLKVKSSEEILLREVMIEGILSIQAGDNPRIVEEKLKAFLPPALREEVKRGGGWPSNSSSRGWRRRRSS